MAAGCTRAAAGQDCANGFLEQTPPTGVLRRTPYARLRELGWIDGQTIAIDYRSTEGHPEHVAEIAAEFVPLKVDIIVTCRGRRSGEASDKDRSYRLRNRVKILSRRPCRKPGTPRRQRYWIIVAGHRSRRQASRTVARDRPEPAATGNADEYWQSQAAPETSEVHAAARKLGLEIVPLEIRRAEDIAAAFEGLKAQADAVYVLADPIFTVNRNQIIALALGARLPTIFNARAYVQGGGLMSYGPDFSDQFRRCAELVDKILHGAKPGDIPVEQPTKYALVINLKTAKSLGLTIPASLLVTADEVIE